jgi:hypothetical protein
VAAVPGNCINLAEMPSISNVLRHLAAVVAVGAACAACAAQAPYDLPNTLGVLPPPTPVPIWLGAVHGTGTTRITGAASATPSSTPGWLHVLISVGNSVAGGTYAWSLRSGSCAAQGNVIGPANRYADFNIHADGSGAAEAAVPETLSPSAAYSVVATPAVSGAAEPTAPAVCADLVPGSM